MHHVVREDRLWFQNNPGALVRFRTASPGEFTPLFERGEQPPFFRPSICRPTAPLRWVAVVDLMRLVDTRNLVPDEPTARLRLKVPALRSNDLKRRAEQELKQAIAAELLENLDADAGTIAA